MCEVCGCGDPRRVRVDLGASLLAANDAEASHLREHFETAGLTVVNLMGSPGAGKTALLEATARRAGSRGLRLRALSGDLATSLDAERLARAGIPSKAITTGSACHLDAAMVHDALHEGPFGSAASAGDVLFIENVGNLVCPAIYDLGQRANVVVLSVTEGVDKPLKYPVMFRKADLVVLTKVDLLPYLPEVSTETIRSNLVRVMPNARMIEVSARTGTGVDDFLAWLSAMGAPARQARGVDAAGRSGG